MRFWKRSTIVKPLLRHYTKEVVKMLLDQKLHRDMWAIKGRVGALVLIIASGVAIFFAIQLALQNLLATQDQLLSKMNFADVEVILLPEDVNNLPDFGSVGPISQKGYRLVFPGSIVAPGRDPVAGLVLFQQEPEPPINQIRILEGRPFHPGSREVVIDKSLAEYHKYKIGDTLSVKVGKPTFQYEVVGIAMSPEFLVTSANPDYVIAEPGSLGVMWADLGQLTDALGFTMVNSLLFRVKEGEDPQVAAEKIMQLLKHSNVEKVIPKTESYSYKSVRMDLTAFGVYSPAIIVTLCLLSIAMGVITFQRFVLEKQKEFGVLAALGYSRAKVFWALSRVGFLIGLAGAVVGLAIGWAVGWLFAEVYAGAMHLPFVIHQFDLILALTGLLLGIISGGVTLITASAPIYQRTPRQLLAPQMNTKEISFQPKMSSLGVVFRFSARSLLRDKALTVSSVLAMGGAVGVAISYGLAMTSTFGTVEASFNQEKWSHAVDFRYPLYEDEAESLLQAQGIERQEPYFRTAGDVRFGDRHAIAVIVGLSTPSAMHVVSHDQGRAIQSANEIVISADLARELGKPGLGSQITVDKGTVLEKFTVVGITNDIFLKTVNVALPVAQTLAQAESKVTGYYLTAARGIEKVLPTTTDAVARVVDKTRLVDYFRQEIRDKMGIVYITIVFSVGVSLLFVTTLVYLSIAEKRGEYAILRSMGFTVRKLRRMILTEVGIRIVLALTLSIPVSLALVRVLNERMGKAWFAIDLYCSAGDFMLPMLAVFTVAPLVGLFGARSVLRLNIPEILRERAI